MGSAPWAGYAPVETAADGLRVLMWDQGRRGSRGHLFLRPGRIVVVVHGGCSPPTAHAQSPQREMRSKNWNIFGNSRTLYLAFQLILYEPDLEKKQYYNKMERMNS